MTSSDAAEGFGAAPREVAPGLYLVGTPIGNLEDLTLRAIRLLRAAHVVAAEDTRRTRALLSHLGITGKDLVSVDAHATDATIDHVLDRVEQGRIVCLVTDAGMPSVSDPGSAVVRRALDRGLPVVAIPGPSALTTAVALSGLVDHGFTFLGFLPRKGEKRRQLIAEIVLGLRPMVLFEAGNRLTETLSELAALAPDRLACVARELTKLHEEVVRLPLRELVLHGSGREPAWRGEVTLVVGASGLATTDGETPDWAAIDQQIKSCLAAGGTAKTIARDLAVALGLPRKELYSRVLALRATESDPSGEGP